jgi:hypothetical protein
VVIPLDEEGESQYRQKLARIHGTLIVLENREVEVFCG